MRLSILRLKISICGFIGVGILLPSFLEGQSSRPKVGLALSGGGARGAAHIGVLKVLERENIPIDYIAGTSMGALVGGLYAVGYSAAELEEIFLRQDWSKYFSNVPERQFMPFSERTASGSQVRFSFDDWTPELPKGLYEGQPLREIINELTILRMLEAQNDFDRLHIPFRAVATDLVSGTPYEFSQGSMSEAIRASIALPVFFTPVEKDEMLLADGGVTNNLPADVVSDMGADIVIAVDTSSPLLKKEEINNLLDESDQTTSIGIKNNMEKTKLLADEIIEPDLDGFSIYDFSRIPDIIKQGETETDTMLKVLKNKVSSLSQPADPYVSKNEERIIDSVKFDGLKNVPERQARKEIRVRGGENLDLPVLIADMKRLYATQLFESVEYYFEPLSDNHYHLIIKVKESSMMALDAGIRYDNEYEFVALAKLTSRQLFNSPTTLTVSSQFGGLEDHAATLRYSPSYLPFLFVEPKVYASRRERQLIQNQELMDDYTVKRLGGQLMVGGTFFKQVGIAAGYRFEDARALGGSTEGGWENSGRLGGFTFHVNRDTLNDREFPSKGMALALQADVNEKRFGGDFDYFKVKLDLENYFAISDTTTLGVNLMVGFAEHDAPFYDGFYLGGHGFSTKGSHPLVGYDRDEILSEEAAVLGIQYRRRIYHTPLGFVKSAYLTTSFNSGIDEFLSGKGLYGAGIGVAVNTILGPIRVAGGFGDGGRTHFYFTLGPEF